LLDIRTRVTRRLAQFEEIRAAIQIITQDIIEGKHACQCAPLCCHVGDAHALIHRHAGDPAPRKLDCHVQHFVVIEQAAEGDDDVLADNTGLQFAGKRHTRDRRNLPPCLTGRPNCSRVGPHDRRAKCAHRAI